ncbi:MAG: hypothetical protein GQ582_06170 [Methyloprofundus sp.]|nr:hypothetical protein [Methyloprofundus sp.]
MASYPKKDLGIFMTKVNKANTHFTLKRSSLKSLMAILGAQAGTAEQVAAALRAIVMAKQQKYWEALLYLRETYPQLPIIQLQGGSNLKKLNAAKFRRNQNLPTHWNEDFSGREGANKLAKKKGFGNDAPFLYEKEIASESNAFIGKSLEHYIYENKTTVVGVLIHMGSHVPAMDELVEGISHTAHLNSVLGALAKANAPLCVLLQNTQIVCGELLTAVTACNPTTIIEKKGHMGGQQQEFQEHVKDKTVIMMGFDGDVCVAANSFGSNEILHAEGDRKGRLVVPIINLADIVTSRAVLVTSGTLNKVEKWGVLRYT